MMMRGEMRQQQSLTLTPMQRQLVEMIELPDVAMEGYLDEVVSSNPALSRIVDTGRGTEVGKAFGEDLSRFYFDRYGIQSACLRIGSATPEPLDRRMVHTWLSYRDLTQLVLKALTTPQVGHTIVYGMSANRDSWWDNSLAAHIGFHAQDSSEEFRAKVTALPALDPSDPAGHFQGGGFVKAGPFETL